MIPFLRYTADDGILVHVTEAISFYALCGNGDYRANAVSNLDVVRIAVEAMAKPITCLACLAAQATYGDV